MTEELYSDGVGELTVTGTVIRLDFISLSPAKRDANNNPQPVFRQRIIMPVDAFANTVDLMQRALVRLIETGAVQRNNPNADMPAANDERIDRPGSNSSPNFN